MRVGVIRGDLPGPILLADLEPVSRYNPPTEPRGQERYISRPTQASVEAALSGANGAGATIEGSDISGAFPITINAGNDDLLVKTSATAVGFTTVLVPQATYTTLASLLTALNSVLLSLDILARAGTGSGDRVGLEYAPGVDSYLEVDVTANSVANAPLGFPNGVVRTMPSAADFITDCLPVGGPLDVSTGTLNGVGAGTNANALSLTPTSRGAQTAMAGAIAPQFLETGIAVDCFLIGNMAELLSANFNPDSRRTPPITNGAAITVVQNDGVSLFTATLPTITTATLNTPGAGDVTIAGTGLGNAERNETMLKFAGDVVRTITQQVLELGGGSVSATAIVIPAALIPAAATTTTSVQVQVRQRVSAVSALV
jgi:hypothetical protein